MVLNAIGFKELIATIATILVTWNLINTLLGARRTRQALIDGPRSDRVALEDLRRDFENFRAAVRTDYNELHKKASTLPNSLQQRIGEMEVRNRSEMGELLRKMGLLEIDVRTRLAELSALTKQGQGEHERYEFALQEIMEKLAHLTGRIDAAKP